jgi:hypothetical protein
MNRRTTFRMLGSAMVVTLAGEALPHLATMEQCVGTAEEIILCGPSERLLDRRLDHAPERDYDTFGGWSGSYVVSGGQIASSSSTSAPTFRYVPTGEVFFGR